ncbi:aliphatic sulfonate ABC transporter substrate-binding protein [Methylobacterium radiotolerans]|uniref:Aliphatic sulfonates family ABC transporter, periplsmic ligand-binding protein n=1 Tax=Methylobacterium radiotolerans (strain ATCC 27329 / DSM 1819 / JCM 2831 / NBRC 15690 / NCIMB 10815 / 0-1) TaxID=426355 RepID=B1M9A9_METRJ|nr:aliphatic sulfonate ABC transporter substrate-binding protein [Methylobacterium radiotolerans]ACB28084.1 aliphatic sulfonates family ABC transporter, periplsmic ligand-binding protein [Methylobacterium radiotolerans JCM 2831]GEN00995.1 taurine ABC transporter substrate-binding protein [Methylobacterium radiotolerans]
MKRLALWLALLGSLLLGAAPAWAQAGAAQGKLPIRIGFQTGEVNVLLSYAVQSGLFEKEGLAVTLAQFPAGPAMLPALAAGEVDLAWMGEFPAVTGYANGLPIEILFMERIDATNVRLVANPAAGIASLPDLKGKRIGVAIGSTSHYHLLRALAQAGLKAEDVRLVNLAPANMPPAYAAGQIDAAFVWEPNVGAMERMGAKPIASTKSLGMITGGVWVARKAFVTGSGPAVQRFLKAWDRAQKDYADDPAAVRAAEAKRIGMGGPDFDALVAGQSVAHPSFRQTLTADFLGAPGQEMDSRLMKHLHGIAAFLVAEKRIQAPPADWSGLFDTKPIQTYLAGASQ